MSPGGPHTRYLAHPPRPRVAPRVVGARRLQEAGEQRRLGPAQPARGHAEVAERGSPLSPKPVAEVGGVQVHREDFRARVGERQLDPEPDLRQRAGEAAALRVEQLGQLLVDRAAARIAAALEGRRGGPAGAVGDVDDDVGVEVLVLGRDRGSRETAGRRPGFEDAAVGREDRPHPALRPTDAGQAAEHAGTRSGDGHGRDGGRQNQLEPLASRGGIIGAPP
ncbi:MAG: hypothetical protein U0R71_14410 [Solirubrobacterales bacterium]